MASNAGQAAATGEQAAKMSWLGVIVKQAGKSISPACEAMGEQDWMTECWRSGLEARRGCHCPSPNTPGCWTSANTATTFAPSSGTPRAAAR